MKRWIAVGVGVVAFVSWKFVLPFAWGSAAAAPISLDAEPVQTAIEPPEEITVTRGGQSFTIEKLYTYEVQGEVLSASKYDLTWTNDFFDVDLGLIWGPKRESLKHNFKFFQMGRWLFWRTDEEPGPDLRAVVTRSISNNHAIPAEGSKRVASMLRRIGKGDVVRLKGALVKISGPGGEVLATSSFSRDDTGDGACEVVWIDELQVGGRLYR